MCFFSTVVKVTIICAGLNNNISWSVLWRATGEEEEASDLLISSSGTDLKDNSTKHCFKTGLKFSLTGYQSVLTVLNLTDLFVQDKDMQVIFVLDHTCISSLWGVSWSELKMKPFSSPLLLSPKGLKLHTPALQWGTWSSPTGLQLVPPARLKAGDGWVPKDTITSSWLCSTFAFSTKFSHVWIYGR